MLKRGSRIAIAIGWLLAWCAGPLSAEVLTGESDAYGVWVDLDLQLLPVLGGVEVTADVAPVAPVQGTAPAPYNLSNQALSLDVGAGAFDSNALLDLTTGVIPTTAASTVDGVAGAKSASATSRVDGLATSIVATTGLPLLPDVVTISATTIQAASTVSGDFGALVQAGSLYVEDLVIQVQGIVVANLDGIITPNFSVDVNGILGGVSILLNEQIVTGDGLSALDLVTNGIHIRFDNVGVTGVGTLNGDFVVAHTSASLLATPAAVPEPSSLLLLAGMGGVGFVCQRMRRNRHLTADSGA